METTSQRMVRSASDFILLDEIARWRREIAQFETLIQILQGILEFAEKEAELRGLDIHG
jgi:hypothetical protein